MTIESLDQTYLPKFIEFFKVFLERAEIKRVASKDATLFCTQFLFTIIL